MLLAYSLVSGETIAGSANRSNLGVIPSGPAALFGFRALIFLDTDSSGIEQEEIVLYWVSHHYSLPFRVQLGFSWDFYTHGCEESVHQVSPFSSPRTVSVFSSRLIMFCSWARHFTLTVPLSTQVYKWVPGNLMLVVTLRWTSIPSRGE